MTRLLSLVLLNLMLAPPWCVLAETQTSRDGEAGTPYHEASVTENVLTLSTPADFQLEVADDFIYLGSTSFLLKGRAETDVFYFVEADGDAIQRLIHVQVETLVDDSAKDYNWEGDLVRVGDAEYRHGLWCFDVEKSALERPESDTARIQEWLAAAGYRQEGVFVGTRLARIFANGRSELLLFYGETIGLTGIDCGDEDTAREHLPSIIGRSESAFRLGKSQSQG